MLFPLLTQERSKNALKFLYATPKVKSKQKYPTVQQDYIPNLTKKWHIQNCMGILEMYFQYINKTMKMKNSHLV